jgi:hypothetical protein
MELWTRQGTNQLAGRNRTASPRLRVVAAGVLASLVSSMLPVAPGLGGSGWHPTWIAQAQAQEDKPSVGLMPFSRLNDAGAVAASRLEEYLRQMLEAGGAVRVVPAKTISAGKASEVTEPGAEAAPAAATPAQKSLDKADKLAITARDMLGEGTELADALTLLENAAKRYEDNFVELVDFTKLIDVYAMAAQASLALGNAKGAKGWVTKALTIQPTFVVDGRKSNKELAQIVTEIRAALEPKATGELQIEATPADAEIYVDGVRVGSSPATVQQLVLGNHYVQVRKSGSPSWGQVVQAKAKPVQVVARLTVPAKPEDQIEISVSAEDAKAFADSGKFHERLFKNTAALFAKQVRASHLLYGAVSRSPKSLDLHLFLFNAKLKKTCALDPVPYSLQLTNLQMQTLDAEGAVRAALSGNCKEVNALPTIFEAAPAPVEVEPTRPEIVPTPAEPEEPVRVEPKPKPESVVVRPAEPKRAEPERSSDDPYAGLLEPEPEDKDNRPIYKKWWFWTGVGVVVAAGAGAGIWALTRPTPEVTGFGVQVKLP